MPSESLQWAHPYDETDMDTRLTIIPSFLNK
jgi:hypothetical protein